MKTEINILMIDDHPPILDGYELLLKQGNFNTSLNIERACNIDQAINKLFLNDNVFDLILLDIQLSSSKKYSITNGEELGLKIKKNLDSKIIVLTALDDTYRIQNLLDNLQPEGLIIKTQINKETLFNAVIQVLDNKNYLCDETLELRSLMAGNSTESLDIYDLKIIHLIAGGEKLKNFPNHLPLSLSSVERRKRKIKLYFNLDSSSDFELLEEAKRRGFI